MRESARDLLISARYLLKKEGVRNLDLGVRDCVAARPCFKRRQEAGGGRGEKIGVVS